MTIESMSEHLIENADAMAREIIQFNVDQLDFEIPEALIEQGTVGQAAFIRYLGLAITFDNYREVRRGFLDWNRVYGEQEPSMFDKVSSVARPYPDMRLFLNEMITRLGAEHQLSLEETALIHNRLNYLLDLRLTESILAFERYKDGIHSQTRQEMLALSAPIVTIQNGIAVLPLIGLIDEERAEHFSEKVIPRIGELDLHCLIIDFSGIVTVNSEVAGYLMNVNRMLVLLGIKVVVTGMRPDLAKSMVSQSIDFASIKAYLNVKQALDSGELSER